MKGIAITALVILCLLFARQTLLENTFHGSGKIVEETRLLSSFDHVDIQGPINLFLTQGKEESIRIEAEDNIIGYVITEINNGELLIKLEKPIGYQKFLTQRKINVYATTQNIKSLSLKGSGHLTSKSIWDFKNLDIRIKGSGNVYMSLKGDKLTASLKGSGTMNFWGSAQHQEISILGSGNYKGQNLQSETASVSIKGSGTAIVNVEKLLDARISGSGTISYQGEPNVFSTVQGSGITKKL